MKYDKPYEYKPYKDSGDLRAAQTKTGPKSPDYFGNLSINLKDMTAIKTVDGLTVLKLSGWKKVDTQGKTYLSLAVDRFVPQAQSDRQEKQSFPDDDQDIPF
jgi:hypothetical protein